MDNEEKVEEKEGNLPPEVTKVLEELKTQLESAKKPETKEAPAPAGPTASDRRAALQKSLGFNDEQMAAHERSIMESQAPVIETLGWNRLDKKADIDTYRAEIQKELSLYPQANRGPELMEKVYYMVKGRHADSKPATKETPKTGPGVERTRVSGGPGYTGNEPGLSGRSEAPAEGEDAEALDEREKFVAAKMGISEKDYVKARNVGRNIRELKLPDDRPATSMADVELRRMTQKR